MYLNNDGNYYMDFNGFTLSPVIDLNAREYRGCTNTTLLPK